MTPFWTHFGDIPGVWVYLIPRDPLYSKGNLAGSQIQDPI